MTWTDGNVLVQFNLNSSSVSHLEMRNLYISEVSNLDHNCCLGSLNYSKDRFCLRNNFWLAQAFFN